MAFLNYVCDMPLEDMNKRRAIINILVHSVYLYDDYFTLIINTTRKPMSVDHIPLEEISHTFNEKCNLEGQCSFNSDTVPPRETARQTPCCFSWRRWAKRGHTRGTPQREFFVGKGGTAVRSYASRLRFATSSRADDDAPPFPPRETARQTPCCFSWRSRVNRIQNAVPAKRILTGAD